MLGADLPETRRNRLLRRVDWRYLLPMPRVEKAVCLPDGDLREGVALMAGQVVARCAEAAADCDLAVAIDPSAATLENAWTALRPGGVCYGEWHAPVPGGTRTITGRLRAAGFRQVRSYLAWPSASRPHIWIPLDSPGAIAYFRRHLHARSAGRMLAARMVRSAITLAAKAGAIGPLCFVARKPGAPGAEDAEPHLVTSIRRGWSGWGLEGEPIDLAIMLLTRGPRASSKIAGLVFAGASARPRLVVKIARVADARAGLLREAATLPGLLNRCPGRLRGAPKVLFTVDDENVVAVGETALPGVPLLTVLRRRNYRAYALQATDWLVDLARCAPQEERPPGPGLVHEAIADFRRSFGGVLEPELLTRTLPRLARLDTMPRVCEHRDFAPWNVFVAPDGGLSVFDWESSEPAGLPALDLLYSLTYLAFALDRANDTPAMLRSYRAAMDQSSYTAAVHRECLARYAAGVGLEQADWHALRLLTWIIHSRSEYRRLTADAAGPPPPEALGGSLFLGLWSVEARRGS